MKAEYTCNTRPNAGIDDPSNVKVEADTYDTVSFIRLKAANTHGVMVLDVIGERRLGKTSLDPNLKELDEGEAAEDEAADEGEKIIPLSSAVPVQA